MLHKTIMVDFVVDYLTFSLEDLSQIFVLEQGYKVRSQKCKKAQKQRVATTLQKNKMILCALVNPACDSLMRGQPTNSQRSELWRKCPPGPYIAANRAVTGVSWSHRVVWAALNVRVGTPTAARSDFLGETRPLRSK